MIKKSTLVTGGAGFIGSHFVRYILNKYPSTRVINVDLLTYCGNLENVKDVAVMEPIYKNTEYICVDNVSVISQRK